MAFPLLLTCCLLGGAPTTAPDGPLAPAAAGRELICRGYEDSGNITEDQPGWRCHLVNLFVTDKNPHSPGQTVKEHIRWVNDPAHSYVNDGTGGLVVWAHPRSDDAEAIVAADGLAGLEINHGGESARYEPVWDRVLTLCHDRGQPYLWGFAGDDSHSKKQEELGLSFLVARMDRFTETALKAALRAGAFYASSGPLIEDIQVRGGTITIRLPVAGEVRWLKSGQFGAASPATVGAAGGENHCLRRDVDVCESRYALNDADATTDPKAARFVRALVIGRDGKVAQVMPFRILRADRLANPYPPAGSWFRGQTHNHCDTTGPKQTPILDYHRAYRQRGHHWTFGTDYGYWLTPFQRHPDVLATVRHVRPDRGPRGKAVTVTVFGQRFGPNAKVLIAGRPAEPVKWLYENRIEATVPADLPLGCHDVTVLDGEFKDTLAAAYTVQADDADNTGWTSFTTLDSGLPADKTFCVAFDRERAVWVGTQFGAARFDGKTWQAVTRDRNDFIGDAILTIAADAKGNVWFGSFRGLTRLAADGGWRIFRTEDGLPSREINRVFIDSRDELWMTYNGRSAQLSHFDGKVWRHLTPPNAEGQRMSLAVGEDAAGRILVSPRNSGVALLDRKSGQWETWTTQNSGLPDNFVRHVRRGPDGTLYFATTSIGDPPAGGLAILRDGRWTVHQSSPGRWVVEDTRWVFQPPAGPADHRIWDLCVDRAGNVWCATSWGVSRLSPDGRWQTFNTRNSGLAFDFVMGLAESPDGAIWMATARGVSRYQAK